MFVLEWNSVELDESSTSLCKPAFTKPTPLYACLLGLCICHDFTTSRRICIVWTVKKSACLECCDEAYKIYGVSGDLLNLIYAYMNCLSVSFAILLWQF